MLFPVDQEWTSYFWPCRVRVCVCAKHTVCSCCVCCRELVISLDFTPACHEKLSEHMFTRLKGDELLPPVCVQSDGTEAYSRCRRWLNPCNVCVCVCTVIDNSSGLSEQCDSTQQLYEALPRTSSVSLSVPVFMSLALFLSVWLSVCLYSPFLFLFLCFSSNLLNSKPIFKKHKTLLGVSPSVTSPSQSLYPL